MYWERDKENFIQYYMTTRVVAETSLRSLFKKTEPHEEKLGKDCSQFSRIEILAMYEYFKAMSAAVLSNYNTMLKAYSSWQKDHSFIDGRNDYADISQEVLIPLIPKYATKLFTREEILEIEDHLLNQTDKAIVECLWEGLSGDSMLDLVSVNSANIDSIQKQAVFSDGRAVPLTDHLLDLLFLAFDETEYQCYGESSRIVTLKPRGALYKERENAYASASNDKYFRWVYRKIQLYRDYIGIERFTMKNIAASGMHHYLKEQLSATGLDLRKYLESEAGAALMDKYSYSGDSRVDTVTQKYRQYFN